MRKVKALAIFNAISLIIHISTAWLIQTTQINTLNVGEVSARHETLFTPAGTTFGIWGIIYSLMALLCLYHIVIAYKHDRLHPANADLSAMGGSFIILNLASAVWLYAWSNERLMISLGLIAVQLLCLILIHIRLKMYDPHKISGLKIANQFPLSIYLGWISIATIANASAWLNSIGWNGMGIAAVQWTTIMIGIAVLLSLVMILVRRNIYFGLVVAWGLYGIIIKRELINPDSYASIILTAWIAIGLIGLFVVLQLARNIAHKKPRPIFPSPEMPIK